MNIVWAVMILCGIFIAFLTGKIDIINDALLIDTQEAVVFAISLMGIMSIWLGLMNIARKSGLIDILAVSMRPITKFLFPSIPPNHPAISAALMNMIANMFGAGNSATALGIKAMKEFQSLNSNKNQASHAMCMFLVINMSSVQLIPLAVLKIRADAGSVQPADIIITSLFATVVSTIVGVLVCKTLERGSSN
ncbi:MAG: spore maturation protein [Alkaliphilus sp.]|jgi:spore maturation protein A|nr:spore maturation protein [Alkaliphilus transvaalensis]MBN4069826.1 spore maturation protein [bacterium AH-315-G05]PHS31129.1 MAG: spore maturation protein [Alkaliphilus sp.]